MSITWFFLSYSRWDRDNDPHECIRKFYDDLNARILEKIPQSDKAGFYDGTSIQQGDSWPSTLADALNASRTMLCMYSPAYFSSDYCGRELDAFMRRLRADTGSESLSKWPPLIKPIMLEPPEDLAPLPASVADIQMFDDDYPEVYRKEGLRYLMRRNDPKLKDRYQDLLDVVQRKLIHAAKAHQLSQLPTSPAMEDMKSVFTFQPQHKTAAAPESKTAGPFYAEFIYVAGTNSEIKPLGRKIDNYGDEGGLDWKPYLPPVADEIANLAQTVASKEKFRYRDLPLGENIVDLIKDAQENNRLVMIVVDTWSLCLPKYRDLMRKYDKYDSWNTAVLIVWNNADIDTLEKRSSLELKVRQAFITKARSKDKTYFIDNIGSYDDLISNLSVALQKVKLQIIDVTKELRMIDGDLILKPLIAGPGASNGS